MKKFILSLILIIIFNCGGCAPESQTTKYPEGTMVVMKINKENVCQIIPSSSLLWYRIKCPIKNTPRAEAATNAISIDISTSASFFSPKLHDNTGFVEMYVKEFEIEPVKENK